MSIRIIQPSRAQDSYAIAADVFAHMWEAVCGEKLCTAETDDGISDLVLIG